ncbi:MAG: S41 family peptidase [Saprospiraceae bacterium]
MRKIIFSALVVLTTQIGTAQSLIEYAVEDLKADFLELREHLETKNPITYLYRTREEVTIFLDSIEQNINKPMTELDFYRLISPVSSFIKDGHNLIMPSTETLSFIDQNPYNLPIQVAYINNEVYVTANYSANDLLQPQSKIYAINNHSIDSILNRLYLVLPREGLQTQLTNYYINKWFRFFYHLHFGFEESYKIEYSYLDDDVKEIVIRGLPLDDIIEKKKVDRPKKGISVTMLDRVQHAAILNVPSFAPTTLKDAFNQRNFKKELDNCFDTIFHKNIKHLVIDVRENGGGNPVYAVYLLKYLMNEPFVQAIEGRVVNNEEEDDVIKRTRKKWYPWYGIGRYKPKRKNYNGKVYVLISDGTFSAAVEFCSTLRKYKRATFLGVETGGNPIIMTGNYLKEYRALKNTGITHYSGSICTIYDELKLNDGRGIIPAYPVQINIENIILNIDACLEKTISLMLEND